MHSRYIYQNKFLLKQLKLHIIFKAGKPDIFKLIWLIWFVRPVFEWTIHIFSAHLFTGYINTYTVRKYI